MTLSSHIIRLLVQKSNHKLRIPADCEYLALDIESITGERISVNTIKRLTGFLSDSRTPRLQTLDIVARYLGYESWFELRIEDEHFSNSSFDENRDELTVTNLSNGDRIEVRYSPGRILVLRYIGNGHFIVEKSEYSKLLIGDDITLTHFVQGFPLLVSDVCRDGKSLGAFTGGTFQGITYKKI